ncbi:MAG: hypothetical protein ABSA47_03725 [Verrucomicrobiota bacterium]
MRNAIAGAWLALLIPAWAATNSPTHVYPSDLGMAVKIGNALYQTLDERCQRNINPEAISTEPTDTPEITPIQQADLRGMPCQVLISTGFVDLLNHIAHAKAIDRIQPGFFQQYAANLARESAGQNPPQAPDIQDPRYWTEAVMSEQESYFNQMLGMTAAINLSHHYLGHYQKYAGQMLAGKLAPINNFIAPAEWEASVKAAALNSLDCAIATEGAKALFEAIDAMPRRPAWTGFIAPLNTDLKKLNQQLTKYETAYFRGGLRLDKSIASLTAAPGGLAAD